MQIELFQKQHSKKKLPNFSLLADRTVSKPDGVKKKKKTKVSNAPGFS